MFEKWFKEFTHDACIRMCFVVKTLPMIHSKREKSNITSELLINSYWLSTQSEIAHFRLLFYFTTQQMDVKFQLLEGRKLKLISIAMHIFFLASALGQTLITNWGLHYGQQLRSALKTSKLSTMYRLAFTILVSFISFVHGTTYLPSIYWDPKNPMWVWIFHNQFMLLSY